MQYARILNELARPRLATYLTPLGHVQTKDSTRSHFLLNDISQHFYVPLQLIEIVLRNKIHQHASQALKRDDWYDILPATKVSQDMVVEAKRLAATEVNGRQITPDDVVCRLMFGFWAYMLDTPYRNTKDSQRFIWSQHEFKRVFDGAPAGITISIVMQRLKNLNDLRNRLFHHEPIWRSPKAQSLDGAIQVLKHKYADMLDVLRWMSPDLHSLLHAWSFQGRFTMACDTTRFDRDLG